MTTALPLLLRTTEHAFAIGNTLLLPSLQLSPQARASAAPVAIERTLCAFRIPHLPDFLTSPHLTGANERERIAEVLERQTRLIANLGKWKGMGLALRYLSIPERGTVEIAFVVRGLAHAGRGQQLGEQMASAMSCSRLPNPRSLKSASVRRSSR